MPNKNSPPVEADQLTAQAEKAAGQGDWTTASTLFRESLDVDPTSARAWYGLGVTGLALGDPDEARHALGRALTEDPTNPNIYFQLGFLAETLDSDPTRAAILYRQALQLAPSHHQARQRLTGLTKNQPPPTASPAPNPPTPQTPFQTLAAELDPNQSSGSFDQGRQGALIDTHHHPVLRSYIHWLLPPAAVAAAAATLGRATPFLPDLAQPAWAAAQQICEAAWPPLLVFFIGYALLRRATTTYTLYERRVDRHEGILIRRQTPVWLHEVNNTPYFKQSLVETLVNTGTIVLPSDTKPGKPKFFRPRSPVINGLQLHGLGAPTRLLALTEQLRTRVLYERRAMLNQFMAR